MKLKHNKLLFEKKRIENIRIAAIRTNPGQPRKYFDSNSLEELAQSIRIYGILQPLTVRRYGNGFELIAGERRLRAAVMAGLSEVPCVILSVDNIDSSLIALIENLQRQDLGFMEEAEGLSRMIRIYGLSQEETARRVGRSQSAIANKLRLLHHPPEVISIIREYSLTERHARALLRIQDIDDRIDAAKHIGRKGLNVVQSEHYIENLLKNACEDKPMPKIRALYVIKDIRLFLNTLDRSLNIIREAGIDAQLDRKDSEQEIFLTLRIPRQKSERSRIISVPAP